MKYFEFKDGPNENLKPKAETLNTKEVIHFTDASSSGGIRHSVQVDTQPSIQVLQFKDIGR